MDRQRFDGDPDPTFCFDADLEQDPVFYFYADVDPARPS